MLSLPYRHNDPCYDSIFRRTVHRFGPVYERRGLARRVVALVAKTLVFDDTLN